MPTYSRRQILAVPATLITGLLFNACGAKTKAGKTTGAQGASAGDGGPDELFAETASFETLVGIPQRIMVGITTSDGRVLHGGAVRFTIRPVNPTGADADAQRIEVEAAFLPVPRSATPPASAAIGGASEGIGVYAAEGVIIPTTGFWTITVDVPLKKAQSLETAVEVLKTPRVPAVGEKAPPTDNATSASATVPIEAIDSRSGRAGLGTELADPLLHRESVRAVLAAQRPCVVVVSTPTFCTSKFCGPITDVVNDLAVEAKAAGKDTGFVHLEVWRSFDRNEVNASAVEWISARSAAGNEPWVFLVDRRGFIVRRWDNLVGEAELRAAVASL